MPYPPTYGYFSRSGVPSGVPYSIAVRRPLILYEEPWNLWAHLHQCQGPFLGWEEASGGATWPGPGKLLRCQQSFWSSFSLPNQLEAERSLFYHEYNCGYENFLCAKRPGIPQSLNLKWMGECTNKDIHGNLQGLMRAYKQRNTLNYSTNLIMAHQGPWRLNSSGPRRGYVRLRFCQGWPGCACKGK